MTELIIACNIAREDDGLASRFVNLARGLIGVLVFAQVGNRGVGAREGDWRPTARPMPESAPVISATFPFGPSAPT